MKAILSILFINLLGIAYCNAQQNYILNGRFEETIRPDSCIAGEMGYGSARNYFIKNWWTPCPTTTDYYNRCDFALSSTSVPNSVITGYHEDPFLENAYIGMMTWEDDIGGPGDYQEYIATKLAKALEKGKQYIYQMKVSSSNNTFYNTNIGFCIEKDGNKVMSVVDNTYRLSSSANVFMYDSIITTCEGWKDISIPFSPASDSSQFLIIGTFPALVPFQLAPVISHGTCIPDSVHHGYAYYVIDDIRIFCIDCDTSASCALALPSAFTPNNDGLNDEWKPIIQNTCIDNITNYLLRIFDRWGAIVYTTYDKNDTWKAKNNEIGTYVYYLLYDDKNTTKTVQGTIEIIR